VLIGNVSTLTAPFSVTSGVGGFTLANGDSIAVTVQFEPAAVGPFADNLLITSNDLHHLLITVPLSGNGSPGRLAVARRLPFPRIATGASITRVLLVRNPGLGVLHGNVGSISGPFTAISNSGGFVLSHGQGNSVTVRFMPVAPGTATGNLTLTSDDPEHASMSVTLIGSAR
jgi:hypothetical protein